MLTHEEIRKVDKNLKIDLENYYNLVRQIKSFTPG